MMNILDFIKVCVGEHTHKHTHTHDVLAFIITFITLYMNVDIFDSITALDQTLIFTSDLLHLSSLLYGQTSVSFIVPSLQTPQMIYRMLSCTVWIFKLLTDRACV